MDPIAKIQLGLQQQAAGIVAEPARSVPGTGGRSALDAAVAMGPNANPGVDLSQLSAVEKISLGLEWQKHDWRISSFAGLT